MINNSVKKCCICNNDNIGEFITINGKKYHLCCIEDLQKKAELADHYKHLYSEVKKQKDDVVKYIKNTYNNITKLGKRDLLRMLGEIE